MKILNFKEFLKLPEGIMFRKFEPCIFEDLKIKHESIGDVDFIYESLDDIETKDNQEDHEVLFDAMEKSNSFNTSHYIGRRDGLYEENQLYAVLEKEDIMRLHQRLRELMTSYPEEI